MKSILNKILMVMKDVEYLKKDDSVGFGQNQYKAISEEKVTSAVGDSMRNHGLVIIPIMINQKRDDIEVKRKDGTAAVDRLATVEVTYLIADPDTGESVTAMSAGTGIDTQDKAIGKAMTYAYKYLMLRTFCIPTGEDPDKVSSTEQQIAEQKPNAKHAEKSAPDGEANISAKQVKALVMMTAPNGTAQDPELKELMNKVIHAAGYQKADDIKVKDYENIVSAFQMQEKI